MKNILKSVFAGIISFGIVLASSLLFVFLCWVAPILLIALFAIASISFFAHDYYTKNF